MTNDELPSTFMPCECSQGIEGSWLYPRIYVPYSRSFWYIFGLLFALFCLREPAFITQSIRITMNGITIITILCHHLPPASSSRPYNVTRATDLSSYPKLHWPLNVRQQICIGDHMRRPQAGCLPGVDDRGRSRGEEDCIRTWDDETGPGWSEWGNIAKDLRLRNWAGVIGTKKAS